MHDRTRRSLCRALFLLFCVAPTVGVATSIATVRSSWYQASQRLGWERRLAERLGLEVSLGSVRCPARGVTLLGDVVLRDAETRSIVARARQVEWGRQGTRLVAVVSQPVVSGEHVWRLWEVLHDRVLREPQLGAQPAQLFARELTLDHAAGETASTLTDCLCQIDPSPEGVQATLEFRDVALRMSGPATVRITRDRSGGKPATRWELHTRSTALPCSLLAEHVPQLACLGEGATFQGTIEMGATARGWEGEVVGHVRGVDLDRLVTERFDHKLSGEAEIRLRRASVADGRLIDAAGDVACQSGVVSWSLLDQAHRTLGLVADARVRAVAADTYWRFRELRFGFTLSQQGLQIVGHCDTIGEGVVMADAVGPLLMDRPQEVTQAVALVRTLSSQASEQVPATVEAYQLLHVLPIPSSQSAASAPGDPRAFYTPLRVKPLP